MKRNIFKYLLMLTVISGLFSSCEKKVETEGITEKITYYPKFDYKGDEVVLHELGSAFVDPGVTASENGANIVLSLAVEGYYTGYKGTEVNGNVADKYHITYSAVNVDGFSGTAERVVFVAKTGDFVNSIEGLYTSTVVRNGSAGAQYRNMGYIIVSKVSGNTYSISDAIGGYYDLGRAYGNAYRSDGLTVSADLSTSSFSVVSQASGVGVFGGNLETGAFSVNPTNKTIYFESNWDAGYFFQVTLTQVSI